MATSTNSNPFLNFDFTKIMAGFDAGKMFGEFTKMAEQYKAPAVDLEALMTVQRQNFAALETANRMAMEGFQAMTQHQVEFLSDSAQETRDAFDKVSKSKSPEDAATQQVDFMKTAYEKSVANLRELTDMASEIASEASEVITSRVSDGLNELKKQAPKTK